MQKTVEIMSAARPQYTLIQPRFAPTGPPGGFQATSPPSPQTLYTLQPSPPNGLLPTSPISSSNATSSQPPQTLYVEVGALTTMSPTTNGINGSNSNGIASTSPLLTEIKSEPQPFSPQPSHNSPTNPTIYIQQQQQQQPQQQQQQQLQPPQSPLTPTGAVQQYAQMQQQQQEMERKKKGPTPRPQSEELCLVCGDRASGYHYNALACEGCKGFFRRSITRNSKYACKYSNNCEMDMYMRRKCQACRLKKCYQVGMRSECVVPESQCAKKRDAKKAQKVNSQNGDAGISTTNSNVVVKTEQGVTVAKPLVKTSLKPEEEELINRLVYFQEEFEHPTEDDLNRVYHVPLCSPENAEDSESDRLFRHMTEMTILTVQLIVEFSKHLPGFQTLCREDQITLLKGCSSEVMMLRGARRYDPQTDSIVYATNYPFTKENYVKAGLGNEELFRFCRNLSKMKVDNAEYALITAIVIFSDRNNLKEPKRVEKIQEIYVDALQAYVMAHRKKLPMICFARMLSVLVELRTLGNSNSELCFSLKLNNRKLPPFLMEIWDIQ